MDQIFIVDKTSLNYKMLPSKKAVTAKADREVSGAKKECKECVAVLMCTNVSRSFRLPLLVIGKLVKPRALKNYNFQLSPVVHKNQKSAWIDIQFFQIFVSSVKKKRKVIFLKKLSY